MRGIKRWMRNKEKTKYAAELDIYHFYDSLQQEIVMNRMKKLIKDRKILIFIEKLISNGIQIGAYFSQWFANTVLQELDIFIRQELNINYYIRYMDNLTLFSQSKAILHNAINRIKNKLSFYKLKIKNNWQVYPTNKRLVCGLGYRYGYKFLLLRKRTLFKLKKHMSMIFHSRKIGFRVAAGLVSRIGALKWCNSRNLLKQIPNDLVFNMKRIISSNRKKINNRLRGDKNA